VVATVPGGVGLDSHPLWSPAGAPGFTAPVGIPAGPAPYAYGPPVPDSANRPPAYPLAARRAGKQGTVTLGVELAGDGRVTTVRIEKSSGFPALDDEAARAIREWRFKPARVGPDTVPSQVSVPVRFILTE
jgi:periplasmic protein TonB